MEQVSDSVVPSARRGKRARDARETMAARFDVVRGTTESLVETLGPEDQNLQSMAEASPAKWHRAHTTWFFETFVLERLQPDYESYDPAFVELFNSYYNAVGRQHPRPYRSMLSRPDADEVGRYRRAVDSAMREFIASADDEQWAAAAPIIELGTHHEQQHQELLLTDIKHAFSFNPLAPALGTGLDTSDRAPAAMRFIECPDGMTRIGADGPGFCFDNETPRHKAWLPNAFALADRPVNCAEFLEFIEDGGYDDPLLWLSDGWAWVQSECIESPLYWERPDGEWLIRTLAGTRALDPAEPVCHVSFYEACAFAEWSGCRLPTEIEWEHAAAELAVVGHFSDRGRFHPAAPEAADDGFGALFGDVWEWTASAYGPYPGFEPAAGAIGEYNGKFMANQMVLRGGSCATPVDHLRPTYRNFFYPPDRWQFSGIRLARDIK